MEGGRRYRILKILNKSADEVVHFLIRLQIEGTVHNHGLVVFGFPFRSRGVKTRTKLNKVAGGKVKGVGIKIRRKIKLLGVFSRSEGVLCGADPGKVGFHAFR